MKVWLVVEDGSRAGTVAPLGDEPVVIGREPGVTLQLGPSSDLSVSARHAVVAPTDDGGWRIRDLDSTNGTWIDGRRLDEPRTLQPGNRIRLGRSGPTILFTDREPATAEHLPPPTAHTPILDEVPWSGRELVAIGILTAAVLVGAFAYGTGMVGGGDDGGSTPATPTATDTTAVADRGSPAADQARADTPDTTEERLQREIEELRARVLGLDQQLQEARNESDDLRRALEAARERGASRDEVEALERRLQEATAALRRQRLAGSVDIEAVSEAARAATAQLYVEFEGGRVEAATGFGVGSGGLVVTAGHVLEPDEGAGAVRRVGVQYAGERGVLPADVERISDDDDLALLRIRDGFGGLPSVRSINRAADTLSTGSPLVLLGYPLGGTVVQDGARRPVARPLVSVGVLAGEAGGLLELEGYANVGASGSPVLDASGQVVGVIMGGRREGSEQRLFAVPSERIVAFLRDAGR